MNVNFMPWREEKNQKNNKLIFMYSFIFIIFILILIKIKFIININNNKYKNNFISNKVNIDYYNSTLWLLDFLYNIPHILKTDDFLSKISINKDIIKINISTGNIDNIEKFVEKIKTKYAVKRINIDSGESVSVDSGENKENKFIVNIYKRLYGDNNYINKDINKLISNKFNNKIISKIYKISELKGIRSDIHVSDYIYIKSRGGYKNLIEFLVSITKEFNSLLIFSLSVCPEGFGSEYNGDINMNVVLGVC